MPGGPTYVTVIALGVWFPIVPILSVEVVICYSKTAIVVFVDPPGVEQELGVDENACM
jgi:hypothetical protein